MYLEHFGLHEAPFRITPHTDFFFDGADRGTTLEALLYAILHDEGIVKVSGEIGSGKTMLCRVLMERLPAEVETVFLANPSFSREEILYAIADELGLRLSSEPAAQALRALQAHLIQIYAGGRRVVILIDEAHAMPEDTLEEVRLLSNLESTRHKLLQIVLFGQPELDQALAKPSMRQLKDRITHSFRTRPLSEEEVAKYVTFRMRAAGYRGPDAFQVQAVTAIARASGGLTRRINVLADKALLAAFAADEHAVTPRHVRTAAADSEFARIPGERRGPRSGFIVAAGLLTLGALAGAGLYALLRDGILFGATPVSTVQPAAIAAPPAAPSPAAVGPVAPGSSPEPGQPPNTGTPAPQAAGTAASPAEAPAKPTPQPSDPVVPAAVEKPAAPLLGTEKLRRLSGYAPGASRLVRERLAATRDRLRNEPDASYSIELFETENSDVARLERFLLRARDMVPLEEVYVIPVVSGRSYHLRVTFGVFPTQGEAADAARRLPPKYQRAFQTELRSFGELRDLL